MTLMNIPIDLDVYKALEAKRSAFDEPHNSILRRVLGISGVANGGSTYGRTQAQRSTGTYTLQILGQSLEVKSIKDGLRTGLMVLEKNRPGFLEKLGQRPTARGRYIVSKTREGVYPQKPHLKEHAAELIPGWYFDTNISRKACERYLAIAGLVAEVETPNLT